jgi:hypothetical protein
MEVAGGHAAMPPVGKRTVGSPHRSADEANGARAALPLPRHLVALHGFIKKTRATPDEDLAMARKRQKELVE